MQSYVAVLSVLFLLINRESAALTCYVLTESTDPVLPANAPNSSHCLACTKLVTRIGSVENYAWDCEMSNPYATDFMSVCIDMISASAYDDNTNFNSYCRCCTNLCNNASYRCDVDSAFLATPPPHNEPTSSSADTISCYNYSSTEFTLPPNAPVLTGCRSCTKTFGMTKLNGYYNTSYLWSCSETGVLGQLNGVCKGAKSEGYNTDGSTYISSCSCCTEKCNDDSYKCGKESAFSTTSTTSSILTSSQPQLTASLLSCYSYTSADTNLPSTAPIVSGCGACTKKIMRTTTTTNVIWACEASAPVPIATGFDQGSQCADAVTIGNFSDNTLSLAYYSCCTSKCNGPSYKCGDEVPLPPRISTSQALQSSTGLISCYNYTSSDPILSPSAPTVTGCTSCTIMRGKLKNNSTYQWRCSQTSVLGGIVDSACHDAKMESFVTDGTMYSAVCSCCTNNCNDASYKCGATETPAVGVLLQQQAPPGKSGSGALGASASAVIASIFAASIAFFR